MNITREEVQQVIDAISRSRDTAMHQTLAARIPECGQFSGIAQDLDYAISLLQSKLAECHHGVDDGACKECYNAHPSPNPIGA